MTRTLTTGGTDVTHFIHDLNGNVIAETGGTGPASTLREYIWLPGAEIAPTMMSSGAIDRPIAVVEDVETATPLLWYVHVDHLHRPVRMTNSAKATVWNAVWLPWGGVHSITGTGALNARFPGQWFQLEAGLHYNWHRHYDPTLGRYTQPDPLGFVDGPSIYGYARLSPYMIVDISGLTGEGPKITIPGPDGKPLEFPPKPPTTTPGTIEPTLPPPDPTPPGGLQTFCDLQLARCIKKCHGYALCKYKPILVACISRCVVSYVSCSLKVGG